MVIDEMMKSVFKSKAWPIIGGIQGNSFESFVSSPRTEILEQRILWIECYKILNINLCLNQTFHWIIEGNKSHRWLTNIRWSWLNKKKQTLW